MNTCKFGTLDTHDPVSFTGTSSIAIGENFTIEGSYRRRTFWQWLTRQAKQLQTYRVTGNFPNDDPSFYTFETDK